MRKFRSLIVLGVIAVAGCNLSSDLSSTQRIGIINVTQVGVGDTAELGAFAQFFQTGTNFNVSLPNAAAATDSCDVTDWTGDPEPTPPTGINNLNAGSSIALATDLTEASMVPGFQGTAVVYSVSAGTLPFTPGAEISFDIPGDSGGYPAQSIETHTIVTASLAPIDRHPAEDLHLSWSPGGNTGGIVQLAFQYSNSANTTPNRQMLCVLRDDGSYDVPDYVVREWAAAPDPSQSVTGFRWNTTIQQTNDVILDVLVQTPIYDLPLSVPAPGGDADIRAALDR